MPASSSNKTADTRDSSYLNFRLFLIDEQQAGMPIRLNTVLDATSGNPQYYHESKNRNNLDREQQRCRSYSDAGFRNGRTSRSRSTRPPSPITSSSSGSSSPVSVRRNKNSLFHHRDGPPDPYNQASPSPPERYTLVTLPRVELWCRDGLCYPYYKDPDSRARGKGRGSRQQDSQYPGSSRLNNFNNHHYRASNYYRMPAVIPVHKQQSSSASEQELIGPAGHLPPSLQQQSRSRSKTSDSTGSNSNNKNNFISINTDGGASEIYKHRINVKNIPVSNSAPYDSSSDNTRPGSGPLMTPPTPGEALHGRSKRFPSHFDRVTLTIGDYQPPAAVEEEQRYIYSTASMGSSQGNMSDELRTPSTGASSIDLEDYSSHTHSNSSSMPKEVNHDQGRTSPSGGSNYQRNITRCSLGGPAGGAGTSLGTPTGVGSDLSGAKVTLDNGQYLHHVPVNMPTAGISGVTSGSSKKVLADSSSMLSTAHSGVKPNPFCPSCNGIVPLNHHDPIPELPAAAKVDTGFWNSTNNFHSTLHREASFHSCGGFTLNGQPGHLKAKRSKMSRLCSSHKVAFVVSTFSLLVTIGLIITLLLMKKKGMMEAMR